jgi:hypothetical protein
LALYHLKNITTPTPIPSTSSPNSSISSSTPSKEDYSASEVVGLCSEVLSLQLEGQHNSKAHFRRGLAQKSLGRLAEAKRDLQLAFKLSPRDTEIQRSLEPFLLPDGVTLEHSTEKGRRLITTKQVQEKQLVFKEERFIRSKTTFNKNHRDGYRNSCNYSFISSSPLSGFS